MYKKIICLVLAVVSFSFSIIPAEAAGSEKLMCDLYTATDYTCYENDKNVGTFTDPYSYFSGVTKAGWEWNVTTDYIFGYCYFNVYCASKPDKMQVRFYTAQNLIDAEYVGNDGNLYQYRVKCGSGNADIYVQATWNNTYYGPFGIYSFVGVKDFSDSISKIDVNHQAWRVMRATGDINIYQHGSRTGESLPWSKTAIFTITDHVWSSEVVNIDIRPAYRSYNHASEVTFLLSGYAMSAFSIQLMDSYKTAVHVIEPEETSVVANTVLINGDNDRPVIYYEVTADLSEYDLDGLTVRLTFSMDPYELNDTQEYISYTVMDCYMKPYIEDVPWYKTFWNWLSDKWDSVTGSIKSSISSAADKITSGLTGGVQNAINAEKEHAQQMGEGAVNNATDSIDQAVPNKSEGFMSAISTFTGSMSYNGTDAVLAIPALSLPEIPGLIPKTELMSDQELDLESFVEMLPDGLVLLVRSLLTIALIIYCFKELYDTIAYLLTLRKGDN